MNFFNQWFFILLTNKNLPYEFRLSELYSIINKICVVGKLKINVSKFINEIILEVFDLNGKVLDKFSLPTNQTNPNTNDNDIDIFGKIIITLLTEKF